VIREELLAVRDEFGDARRTEILRGTSTCRWRT
jgi:DNA gyrase/topoisomerase IV subunit A